MLQQQIETGGSHNIIGAVAVELPNEQALIDYGFDSARMLARGARLIVMYPDRTVLYARNSLPVPEDDSEAQGIMFWNETREIVSPTNGRFLGSLLTAPLKFNTLGEVEKPWVRMVGIPDLPAPGEPYVFGLVEL